MTNARVIVEMPDFAKGETYVFRNDSDYKYSTPPLTIPKNYKYVSVYIHADGYIEGGLGDKLTKEYTDFAEIMEKIMCGGDGAYIGAPYHGMRGEDISDVGPQFSNDLSEIRNENYNYLYSNGLWYVREYYEKEYSLLSTITPTRTALIDEIGAMIANIKEKLSQLEEKVKEIDTNVKITGSIDG